MTPYVHLVVIVGLGLIAVGRPILEAWLIND